MSPNLHAAEPASTGQTSDITKNVVDQLEQDFGVDSPAVLTSLDNALNDLAERLAHKLSTATKKKESLDLSTETDSQSDIRIPFPDLPEMEPIQKTIQQHLPVGSSTEIDDVHKSMPLANVIRDPENLRKFERRKDDQVRAKLQTEIASLGRALVNVNNVKALIRGRL